MAQPPYDPVKSFAGVSVFSFSSTSIVVNPAVPVHSLSELIAYAKANPGKLSTAWPATARSPTWRVSCSSGSPAGLDIVHIP